ncbi:MAG TPA: hypothetical protein PKO36_10380 [Candidatus Hydrogenedentes bacterium]|nr:hypothetical protein [Candidatus Hydrogenedentota bacterium]
MHDATLRGLAWGLLFLLIIGMAFAANAAEAGKAEETFPRILLVGDSWPWFMASGFVFWTYDRGSAFRDILPETGRERWTDIGDTAVAGSMITQWSTNEPTATPFGMIGKLEWIRRTLMAYPTIDIVHLGLGGNDYIRGNFEAFIAYTPFEWQTIVFRGGPEGGSFTLTFQGQTTAPLPLGASSAEVQSALEALPAIGAGNIEVEDARGLPTYFCTFKGVFANTAVPLMTANGSGLNGGTSPSVTVHGVRFDHGWKETWGTESKAEYAFAYAILDQLRIIVEYTLDSRPDVRVVLTDYDYMDEGVGGADPLTANTAMANGGHIKLELMNLIMAKPQYAHRCYFLNTFGLMQWWFGYPCDFELISQAPNEERRQTTLPEEQYYGPRGTPGTKGTVSLPGNYPDYEPWTGGDLNYPGPAIAILYDFGKAMNDPKWAKDIAAKGGANIHLHKEGYKVFARFAVDTYYGDWLDLPKVLTVKCLTASPAKTAGFDSVDFEVTFSEPVHGVDVSDFSLIITGGELEASIEDVNAAKDGSVYIVSVSLGAGGGTVGLAVNDNDSIRANDDNSPLAGEVNGYFAYGETYKRASLPIEAWPLAIMLLVAGFWGIRRFNMRAVAQ